MFKHLFLTCLSISAFVCEGRLSRRNMQEQSGDAVTCLAMNETHVTVNIRQTLVGSPTSLTDLADDFFWVYSCPEEMKPACELYKSVDGCFEKNQTVACDPVTKIATIDLYTRDNTFSKRDSVPNPRVGKCLGKAKILERTKRECYTFSCMSTN